jgi:oligoribonuclease NrnB/cAMP/cGMP phosphodiesterase (DHH superfamily)
MVQTGPKEKEKEKMKDYRDTELMLDNISMMTHKRVRFIIDDLNIEIDDETYSYNDYLRNKPLPIQMRNKCRKEEKRLLKREREIFKMNEKRVRQSMISLRNKMFIWVAPVLLIVWIVNIFKNNF